MIRTPLRPLARILSARSRGENPDVIERENIRIRHEAMRDSARARAEGRLVMLGAAFLLAFGAVGFEMGGKTGFSAVASSRFWSARFRKALGVWLVAGHSGCERLANSPADHGWRV